MVGDSRDMHDLVKKTHVFIERKGRIVAIAALASAMSVACGGKQVETIANGLKWKELIQLKDVIKWRKVKGETVPIYCSSTFLLLEKGRKMAYDCCYLSWFPDPSSRRHRLYLVNMRVFQKTRSWPKYLVSCCQMTGEAESTKWFFQTHIKCLPRKLSIWLLTWLTPFYNKLCYCPPKRQICVSK